MNAGKRVAASLLFFLGLADLEAQSGPSNITESRVDPADRPGLESSKRADNRYEEMLGRMRAAVEEIAQLYGNPVFLQVFTNDVERASELKLRLQSARTGDEVKKELENLKGKREELLGDIALKEREAARLSKRLSRQRAALDALAAAVDEARKAVEDTAK